MDRNTEKGLNMMFKAATDHDYLVAWDRADAIFVFGLMFFFGILGPFLLTWNNPAIPKWVFIIGILEIGIPFVWYWTHAGQGVINADDEVQAGVARLYQEYQSTRVDVKSEEDRP